MAFTPGRDEQLSEKQLDRGYWWVTHKVQVRKVFTIVLGVVAFVLVVYALYGFGDWFFGSGVYERFQTGQLAQPLTNFTSFREADRPRDLTAESAIVLGAGDKKYDMVARTTNPNPQWWVEFEYRFGDATPAKKAFLLPGESRYLAALGVQSDARPSVTDVKIENIMWHRVNLHNTRPDIATWMNERLNVRITDTNFSPPEATDPVPVWRAMFTVENDTGFSYFNVGFMVTLLSGSRVVGVNQVVISDLRAGERRAVDASWFSDIPTVTKVEVKPILNIFDDHLYIAPGR